jgi:hypothetical protein
MLNLEQNFYKVDMIGLDQYIIHIYKMEWSRLIKIYNKLKIVEAYLEVLIKGKPRGMAKFLLFRLMNKSLSG